MPPGRLKVSRRTIYAIGGLKLTTNRPTWRNLDPFLGLCNEIWRIVPNFVSVAAPLNKKPRERQPQNCDELSSDQINAQEMLKACSWSHSTGVPTFPRRLYCRNGRIRQADWLCPAKEAARWNRKTNRILVPSG